MHPRANLILFTVLLYNQVTIERRAQGIYVLLESVGLGLCIHIGHISNDGNPAFWGVP